VDAARVNEAIAPPASTPWIMTFGILMFFLPQEIRAIPAPIGIFE
jgi:hypothetical protein